MLKLAEADVIRVGTKLLAVAGKVERRVVVVVELVIDVVVDVVEEVVTLLDETFRAVNR